MAQKDIRETLSVNKSCDFDTNIILVFLGSQSRVLTIMELNGIQLNFILQQQSTLNHLPENHITEACNISCLDH